MGEARTSPLTLFLTHFHRYSAFLADYLKLFDETRFDSVN
jgi:hypothetical protein